MTCPITHSCYLEVQEEYEVSSLLFDDSMPDFRRLEIAIRDDDPDMTTQRLRAFYILEVIYSQLIFSSVNHSGVDLGNDFCRQFERTESGLTDLGAALDKANKLLRVEAGELELMGEEENPGMLMLVSVLKAPREIVGLCAVLTAQLKDALRRDRNMHVFGVTFAQCLRKAGCSFDQCTDHLQTLLSITPHNPIQPWNTTTRFQV
jgi:hypothetical protein